MPRCQAMLSGRFQPPDCGRTDALRFRDNGYGTDKELNIEISHRNILF